MGRRIAETGPALFSYGFRPFFLSALLFGTAVVPVWLLVWQGRVRLASAFSPVDWHIHEMIFGYAAAVIAGFLFTAVPNWTGRMPTRGWPLACLAGLWGTGRLAVAGLLPLGAVGVTLVDCAFLLAIAVMVAVEIVAGRNWRNLKVVVPVMLLFLANVAFHVEAAGGDAGWARRLALSVVLFLIILIGGRIIPSFTRNWLAQRRAQRMPVPFGRLDVVALVAAVAALGCWTARPGGAVTAALLAVAGVLHLVRLARWRGPATWRAPLLAMLHLAYLFLPLGFLTTAGAAAGLGPAAAGLHLLGIGTIAGMTVAVMMRATRGHTGRDLTAGKALSLAFALLMLAALVRAGATRLNLGGVDGITMAALLWSLGFAIIAFRMTPWLALPSVARRQSSRTS